VTSRTLLLSKKIYPKHQILQIFFCPLQTNFPPPDHPEVTELCDIINKISDAFSVHSVAPLINQVAQQLNATVSISESPARGSLWSFYYCVSRALSLTPEDVHDAHLSFLLQEGFLEIFSGLAEQEEYVNNIQDLASGVDGVIDLITVHFICHIFQTDIVLFHPEDGCVRYPDEREYDDTLYLLNWSWRCFDSVLFTPRVCGKRKRSEHNIDGDPVPNKQAKQ